MAKGPIQETTVSHGTGLATPADLTRLNDWLRAEHARRPDPWSFTVAEARQARIDGKGIFPVAQPDPDARTTTVAVSGAPAVTIRITTPKSRPARGTFIHMHGGGWVFGQAVESDPRLRRMAETTGLAAVSIDYRLAPEHPFPAALDDCLATARAVLDGSLCLPTDFLAIGGESAGAHLAVVTLLRLRDEDGVTPFHAANLVAGFYDLGLTPAASRQDTERLIINSFDLRRFVELSLPDGGDPRNPLFSPLYADLRGLPPARLSCGTHDILRHDTMFMAQCWADAGNESELIVTPGGCHVFEYFDIPSAEAANSASDAWINRRIAMTSP